MLINYFRVIACVIGVLMQTPSWALKFTEQRNAQGQTVLLVHDCGVLQGESESTCQPYERSFTGPSRRDYDNPESFDYVGDAALLEPHLRSGKYAQVWLYSGGGNLLEGIKIGELLRAYQQFVYVPGNAYCVSACTVAFLGGAVRDVDDAASYEVHAYSAVLGLTNKRAELFRGANGVTNFREFLEARVPGGKDMASRLFIYAQRMLGGRSGNRSIDSVLFEAPDFLAAYWASAAKDTDLERMQTGGAPAVQEIIMRLERETFEWYLGYIRNSASQLGARSDHAIRVLQVMFSSRIAGTAKLDRNTLHEYGYTNVRR